MKYRFFWITAMNPEGGEQDLNQFLSSHRVVHVERHFLPGKNAAWAICVDYVEGDGRISSKKQERARLDYRDVLDADSFMLYAAVRAWRKTEAEKQGVPAYAVASN